MNISVNAKRFENSHDETKNARRNLENMGKSHVKNHGMDSLVCHGQWHSLTTEQRKETASYSG